jgi:hypothetical protein
MSTVSEMLVKAVRDAAVHNPDVQVAPALRRGGARNQVKNSCQETPEFG